MHIYPLFVNVKRQQCLSVSKHNSKQQIFRKKIATKTTVCHTTVFFVAPVLHSLFCKCACVFFPLSVLFIHFRCVFSLCNVPFPFFTFTVPNHLFFVYREIVIFCEWAREQSIAYCEFLCLCVYYMWVWIFFARACLTFPSAMYVCVHVSFFVHLTLTYSRMSE